MSDQQRRLKVRDAILKAAKRTGKHPTEVTKTEVMKEGVSDWLLRQCPLTDVKKLFFPVTEKDLAVISEAKETVSYIKKLEEQLGKQTLLEEKLLSIVERSIKPIDVTPYKPLTRSKYTGKREIVCMLNDVHYGLNVDPSEVSGVNEFNWTVAARRTGYFINEVCDYKRHQRDATDKVNLIINGDLIAGIIHGLTGRDLELLVHQLNGATHILVNAIKRLAENFKAVAVHFTVGNHGDLPHRRDGSRVSSQVYDNFESAILYACSVAFRDTDTVTFHTQKGIYGDVYLPAGRLIYTHGHLLFSKELGNPGTQVKTRILSDAIMRFNNGERVKDLAPASLFLLGHTHAHFSFTTPDGTQVYNVPSLSGVDSYAMSLGINHNLVAQLVFESTEKYIFGDSRLVLLQAADKRADLDEVIKPYNRELVWAK